MIPAYNAARWLAEAIQSVLDRTWEDFEVIVVDDGSTDGTAAVAARFNDPRVRYIRQQNRGLSAARNIGIRSARGTYAALLDADDRFKPDKLSLQMTAFHADPGLGMLTCGYDLIAETGRRLRAERPWLQAPVIDLRTLLFWNPMLPSTLLFRKDQVMQVGGFDESLLRYEDWDLPLRLALAGCRMGWVREVLLEYRRHDSNMSTDPELVPVATAAALEFMSRFFRRSDVPSPIRRLEDAVFGNLYLDASARAYGADLGGTGGDWLQKAVERSPELAEGSPPRWVVALCGHARGTLVETPERYLRTVAANLPAGRRFRDWNLRRLTAEYHAGRAFRLDQTGRRLPAMISAVRALAMDPHLLGNRGLVKLGFRPW